MLIRYSLYYLLARGLPGLVNFAALVIYTRMLSVDDYGRYALVMAGVGLVNVVVFQWLQLVVGRFVPMHKDSPHMVQQPVLGLFLVVAGWVVLAGLASALFWSDPIWRGLLVLSVPLLIAYAWNELNLALVSSLLEPARYGWLIGAKSVLALLIGVVLVVMGFGAYAPLVGLIGGIVIAWLIFGSGLWKGVRLGWPEREKLREYGAYGLPLVVTFALGWVLTSSDRLLIGLLIGEQFTGVYAVGYDIPQQSLGLILVIVNTAAFPLVVHQMEKGGETLAQQQVKSNGELVVTLSLVCAVILIVLAPDIITLLIGVNFRNGALAVMPWIAASAAVEYIKAFHFDVAFHLSRQSRWMVISGMLSAMVNIVLNMMLIPRYGITGAAWATMSAFILAAFASSIFGRKVFPMPAFSPILFKAVLISLLVYFGLWLSMHMCFSGVVKLMAGVMSGGIMGLLGAFLLDMAGMRKSLLLRITNKSSSDHG